MEYKVFIEGKSQTHRDPAFYLPLAVGRMKRLARIMSGVYLKELDYAGLPVYLDFHTMGAQTPEDHVGGKIFDGYFQLRVIKSSS